MCWMLQQGTEKSIFGVIFLIGFVTITTWILQNYISRFNSHGIESFDSWVCYFGEPMKNKKTGECRSKERRRAFAEWVFEISLRLSLQWCCTKPFPNSTYFELKVLIAECVTLETHEKTNILHVAARNREVHYHYNNSVKYHFQV